MIDWPAYLAPVPDEEIRREANRRVAHLAGRGKVPRPCPKCKTMCSGAREARAHCRVPREAKAPSP